MALIISSSFSSLTFYTSSPPIPSTPSSSLFGRCVRFDRGLSPRGGADFHQLRQVQQAHVGSRRSGQEAGRVIRRTRPATFARLLAPFLRRRLPGRRGEQLRLEIGRQGREDEAEEKTLRSAAGGTIERVNAWGDRGVGCIWF